MHIIAPDFSKISGLGLRLAFAVCTQVDWCLEISCWAYDVDSEDQLEDGCGHLVPSTTVFGP